MKYCNISGIDKPLSKIIFGCENPILVDGKYLKSQVLLDEAFRQGINVYDTARVYGKSEHILGKWINKRKIRDQVIVISKGCHPDSNMRITPEALAEDLEESLHQLDTDYIDIYLLHRDSQEADVPQMLTCLNKYQSSGKIRVFGVSNWTHERIQYANKCAAEMGINGFEISSPNYGVGIQVGDPWRGGVSVSGANNKEAVTWYQDNDMPVFAYSCLGRGMFSGKVRSNGIDKDRTNIDHYAIEGYWCDENISRLQKVEVLAERKGATIAQIAMSYVLNSRMNAFPIVRLSTKKRIREAVLACDINLTKEEIEWIEE